MVKEFQDLVICGVKFEVIVTKSILAHVHVCSTLMNINKATQGEEHHLRNIM